MHGLVLLDADGEVLRPSIIWCDQRTEEQCRAITERVGARGELWRQIQADIYGMPVDFLAAEEGAAYGAGLIAGVGAGVGAGVWLSVETACKTAVHVAKRIHPEPQNVSRMNRQYVEYRKLYPALRHIVHDYDGASWRSFLRLFHG
jgi:sugar (pentulose or hexulose) kinase